LKARIRKGTILKQKFKTPKLKHLLNNLNMESKRNFPIMAFGRLACSIKKGEKEYESLYPMQSKL
jgi:hypothetical protein